MQKDNGDRLWLRMERMHAKRFLRGLYAVFALLVLFSAPVQADAPKRILVFGDSLVAGYGLEQNLGFTVQLEAALKAGGRAVKVINAGISGDTSAGGKSRLAWSLSEKPDLMLLELGANDGLRGLDPAETKANLDWILTEAAKAGVPVVFAGMLAPPNLGPEYGAEFDALFPALAQKHGVVFYPFFLEGVAAVAELNQEDGIHPNAEGVGVIVSNILPTILRALDG